ncbi:hypothetical protein [Streptomyces calidiresistens]|uniref:Uncharacterized protein n=1 Tax=Streptomyces calidiresistens TaxID=1485586 RepID=A0A7W3T032_9ACTN|nr:hypothetical protein [Streptomyces calidiresistens]MBB0228400.1 hypothetical protein [Streptomyces calidiresistens]
MSEVEQRRIAMVGTACAVPVLTGAVVLHIRLGDTLVGWARDWPGGPVAFMAALAVVAMGSLLMLGAVCLMHAWPERTPERLHLSGNARLVWAVLSGLLAAVTAVPLALTLRRPGADTDRLNCQMNALDCYLRAEAPSAIPVWITVFLVTGALGSLVLHHVLGRVPTDTP